MSFEIPNEVHELLRQVVPEIESIINTYIEKDLNQESTISKQYVYNRALRKIMHNFENNHEQNVDEIVESVTQYTVKRLNQIYYDSWEYKHRGMNLERIQSTNNVVFQTPYQIMYERPFVNSNQRELTIRPFDVPHWFRSD